MRHSSIIDAIGHTPLVRLRIDAPEGVEAYAKLEMLNNFAMKDRVARQVIAEARRTGALAEGAPIVESSSGTMALGLALVGTHLGHPVHIVTDPRIDPITLAKLTTLGCEVHVVEAMTGQGWQSARLERLAELMAGLPGAFWPRQYSNPQNPAAYRTLADELVADLGGLDVVVGAVGSGGSLCGTSRALLERLPELKVVGVDCVGSVLFAQPDVPSRKQSGLGNSLFPDNIDYTLFDEVHWLSDDEAFDATHRLAREQKIFGGNTSGSVYRILSHLARNAAPGTKLVGIMPDRGDRYVESVYTHRPAGPIAAEPAEVEYGTAVTSWSFARIPRRDRPVLVFVESNTTGTGMLMLRTAVRLGVEPVLFAKDRERYPGLAETGCRVVVCDTDDAAALHDVVAETVAGRTVAGVTTTSEFYLEHSARLAARLGVPGNPVDAMAACRNKALTRRVLADVGIGQPRFSAVSEPSEVDAAIAAVGLPCVVKPVGESGSHDVLWCPDAETAAAHAAKVLAVTRNVRGQETARTALVEEYVAGPEYSAEMFCVNGEVYCVGVTERTLSALPHFVETGHLFPAALDEIKAREISEAAGQALKALGFERGAAHVELKTADCGPVVVEVNARPAGGMIPELVRLATGIDLMDQQVRSAAGLPVSLAATRAKRAGIRFLTVPAPGRLLQVTGVERARAVAGVDQVTVTGVPGQAVHAVRDAYDRLGYVIASGESAEEVRRALDEAVAQLNVVVEADLG
ncbi:pyridoxal-phosphate dependent enzyme [Actinospica robiniae]|uniref:pyridoxal-phosphate dependent enzyme n=1 Tax=Actinospica robiniae TaxID=304901 RepID=UPI000424DFEA|nr:pyridoxal-phosphate dependent enzyme [Actinospica robiniae]